MVEIKHSEKYLFESVLLKKYCIEELLKLGVFEFRGKSINELSLEELKIKLAACMAKSE